MHKEIDILLRAHFRGCLLVDKESHGLLEEEDLFSAQRGKAYERECVLAAPGADVSGPFPGCMNVGGDGYGYQMLGETPHFAIFYVGANPAPRLGV